MIHWKTRLWYFHWNSYIWVLIDAAMYMIITNINLTILSPDVHISSEKFTEWNYVKWHFYYLNRKTYTCKISHSKALVAQEYICGLSNFRVWHFQSLVSLQLLLYIPLPSHDYTLRQYLLIIVYLWPHHVGMNQGFWIGWWL